MIGFILINFIMLMHKFMSFHRIMTLDEVSGQKRFPLGELFFNGWDWSTDTKIEKAEALKISLRETKLTLDEGKVKNLINTRKASEKAALFARRALTTTLSALILISGWALIIVVHIYAFEITSFFKGIPFINYVVSIYQY